MALLVVLLAGCSRSGSADGPVASLESRAADARDGSTTTSVSAPAATTVAPEAQAAGGGAAGGAGPGGSNGGAVTSTVPNLVGMSVAAAEGALAAQGLTSLYVRVDDWRTPRDTVVSQTQAPGSTLPRGSAVTFRVSTGPVDVVVPSVAGQCMADAQNRLTAAGFLTQVFYRVNNAVKFHRVISSDPTGVIARQGSMVTLYVSTNAAQDGCS